MRMCVRAAPSAVGRAQWPFKVGRYVHTLLETDPPVETEETPSW